MALFFDTGVLYAIYDRADAHHLDASALTLHALKGKWGGAYTSNYVTVETTLLLKSRLGWDLARAFPASTKKMGMKELVVDEGTHARAIEIFQRPGEELSLTDASTLVLMDELGIGTLATFDGRSFRRHHTDAVGPGYWSGLSDRERQEVEKLEKGSGAA
jgi:uncharacterized protein